MKKNVMNPYLPLYEYIPDGEPRIFGERLYVYGSHDFAGGALGFCPGDYMVWSASLRNLGEWRCDGVALRRCDCPDDLEPGDGMAAPDVVRGVDGRYYLYYNAKTNICHVAVSDTPEGPFLPCGDVRNADGSPYETIKMFDPGVLVDDDNRVYLYMGFCVPGEIPERFKTPGAIFPEYNMGFELASDMMTILKGPVNLLPGGHVTKGTGFEGHGFFEASSPRKIHGKYVLAYSSEVSHEMAYAIADEPLGTYEYQGVLVSGGDFGINKNAPVVPYGNVHGGIAQIEGDWYIFYHRHTSGQEASRQGCAEKLPIREDGWFGQAEITSCGLNNAPLLAIGNYNACYCCHLTSPQRANGQYTVMECRRDTEPHIFEEAIGECEEEYLHYIANIKTGTIIGYKYFLFQKVNKIRIMARSKGIVTVGVRLDFPDGTEVAVAQKAMKGEWGKIDILLQEISGVHALYFHFKVDSPTDFQSFEFEV